MPRVTKRPSYPVQLLVGCPRCRGEDGGCETCHGFGRVPGVCARCGAPAFHRTPTDIRCSACYYACEMCRGATDERDRLPGGVPHNFIHAFCAVVRQILENAVVPDNTTERAHARAYERTDARAEDTMPIPSTHLVALMREDGFIPTTEAARLTGHGLSTIYEWIASGRLKESTRSGQLHFVNLAELEACCPQVRRALGQ